MWYDRILYSKVFPFPCIHHSEVVSWGWGHFMSLQGCIQKFLDWVNNEITTAINTHWEATQKVMVAKLTRLTHKIAIQLHLMAESCTVCSSFSRQPVQKLLDTPSYNWWNLVAVLLQIYIMAVIQVLSMDSACMTNKPCFQECRWGILYILILLSFSNSVWISTNQNAGQQKRICHIKRAERQKNGTTLWEFHVNT
jgi:hypothetical protein